MTTIACISDLHGHLPDTPKCDILVIAGDIGPPFDWYHSNTMAACLWLENEFKEWLLNRPCKHIVGIAGNHDFLAQRDPRLFESLPWNYLCGESIEIMGLNFYGSPWTPYYKNWAFNLPLGDHKSAQRHWAKIPDNTDVLVTHGPPRGILDITTDGTSCGDTVLQLNVWRVKPRLHVFGHIHAAKGRKDMDSPCRKDAKTTTYVNASVVDDQYRLRGEIEVVTIGDDR